MSPRPTRRGFLGLTGMTAAAAGAAVLPTLGTGTADAGGYRLPAATHPDHPAAHYPADAAGDALTEPLNAGVQCCLERVDA